MIGETGDEVFDDWIQEGQIIVVPQNFLVVKRASEQGLEWIAFKTNANAKVSQITEPFSRLRDPGFAGGRGEKRVQHLSGGGAKVKRKASGGVSSC
ncbi:hypothetical protein SLA2020_345400 [Shorea laevis]